MQVPQVATIGQVIYKWLRLLRVLTAVVLEAFAVCKVRFLSTKFQKDPPALAAATVATWVLKFFTTGCRIFERSCGRRCESMQLPWCLAISIGACWRPESVPSPLPADSRWEGAWYHSCAKEISFTIYHHGIIGVIWPSPRILVWQTGKPCSVRVCWAWTRWSWTFYSQGS